MTQTQTAPAKPAEASPAKPLFGFRALLADLAGWIRRHLLTVCLVLFVILINVGTQIVCALIRQPFPPILAKVSFEALARGRWYTAPISMLYVPNLGRLLIDVPLMLVAFGLAESVIGKNQNRMGVRHHHTGWRGLGHGTVLPIRRAQPPMACDLA